MAPEHAVTEPAAAEPPPRESLWRTRELLDVVNLYSQDSDLWVFRRFNKLHLFNILYLQRRLRNLEKDLFRLMDGDWMLCSELGIPSHDHRPAPSTLEKGYSSYFNILLSAEKTKKQPDPYTEAAEGLASIAAVEMSWTHRFIGEHGSLRKMFAKENAGDGALSILIYSEKAIQRAEMIVVNVGFCFLLICPIFLLSYLEGKAAKLGTFVAFVLAGSVLTSGLINVGNIGSLAVMAG
ncbi:hypothetical protein FGG08_005074 [Glutinoglossum americanum]|uniref:DUF6594 domain-containing protein n=1 Tax=Glutinoglossum americanum TaxID=1670608 RepID=A0A9P8I128_9PEZI|nr:hypothetical protein FGG08_005074 [Glutinoglossum americanum]